MRILVANSNPVHVVIEEQCRSEFSAVCIHEKGELTAEYLKSVSPDLIFFLHWSFIIPEDIHKNYTCVVFHMTDLPFGRGGSPLQNLIARGHTETMMSALQVMKGIDTGPVFLKRPLSLLGTAEEIFLRAGVLMFEMIKQIVVERPVPLDQQGEAVTFKRRTPAESDIQAIKEIEKIYDHIRMLDADGYPRAYIETEFLRFEFSRAALKRDGIQADVKITIKK